MSPAATEASEARPVVKPVVNSLTTDDLTAALNASMRDIQANPIHSLFFGAFYTLGGWFLFWLLTAFNLPYLVYPLASGFALIAPFIAAGLYEISRRREQGLPLETSGILGSIFSAEAKELRWMALVTGFTFIIWIDIAIFLYVIFFGLQEISPTNLISAVVSTPQGGAVPARRQSGWRGAGDGSFLGHRHFLPAVAGQRCGLHHRHDHLDQMHGTESENHDQLGDLHCLHANDRSGFLPSGDGADPASSGPCDLAPVPQGNPFR